MPHSTSAASHGQPTASIAARHALDRCRQTVRSRSITHRSGTARKPLVLPGNSRVADDGRVGGLPCIRRSDGPSTLSLPTSQRSRSASTMQCGNRAIRKAPVAGIRGAAGDGSGTCDSIYMVTDGICDGGLCPRGRIKRVTPVEFPFFMGAYRQHPGVDARQFPPLLVVSRRNPEPHLPHLRLAGTQFPIGPKWGSWGRLRAVPGAGTAGNAWRMPRQRHTVDGGQASGEDEDE